MIKFFRKIRLTLMNENKSTKYLKYAIGEIILVVIGILIALQINNWNENRKEHKQAIQYLKEFKKDLQTDTLQFNYIITLLDENMQSEIKVLKQAYNGPENLTDIWKAVSAGYNTFSREINLKTFQKVQNSGNSTLLGFEELYDQLSNYYIETNRDLKIQYSFQNEQVIRNSHYLGDFLDSNGYEKKGITNEVTNSLKIEQFPIIAKNQPPTYILKFINSVKGRNYMRDALSRHFWIRNKYRSYKRQALDLIVMIEKELAAYD